jgi:c-di-GMP-binding flagellar brake protein YcgR
MSRQGLQEREYVRVMSARPVLVYRGADERPISSYTVDVSGGGLLLAGPDTLSVGESISFLLTIVQGDPPIKGVGEVVRRDDRGRRPISFTSIADLDRRRLVRFIFECQRLERRRGLELGGRRGG